MTRVLVIFYSSISPQWTSLQVRYFVFVRRQISKIINSYFKAYRGTSGDGTPYTTWNDILREKTQEFASSHEGITTLLFSAWSLFSKVFQDPFSYGFEPEDVQKRGGEMWMDHIHPTSKTHAIIGREISEFLKSHPASFTEDESTDKKQTCVAQ